jgi:hypothetical protein
MAKHNRDKQAEVLRRTQAERKEQKKQQALKAIEEIITQKQPLTFANVAKVAGCSIAYLYKWPEITDYIHELQRQQATQLNSLEETATDPKPHSLKTLHEVARNRIRQLEAEIVVLKQENERLRGHVVEIYELRDECERLGQQLRELTSPRPSGKVVPIKAAMPTIATIEPQPLQTQSEPSHEDLLDLVRSLGIKLSAKLKREIVSRSPAAVELSIAAFEQYRTKTDVSNPEGCLLTMICDEAKPNDERTDPIETNPARQQFESVSIADEQPLSIEDLKNLFTKNHE